ncbi:hypothetical protein AB0N76_19255, partial [Kitasatospora sp. NPDC093806]
MSPFVKSRVAEVIVRHGGGTAAYGSGYRISSRLVLTVAHLFTEDAGQGGAGRGADGGAGRGAEGGRRCTVLLGGGDEPLPATLAWRGRGTDLALLRLDPPPGGPGPGPGPDPAAPAA